MDCDCLERLAQAMVRREPNIHDPTFHAAQHMYFCIREAQKPKPTCEHNALSMNTTVIVEAHWAAGVRFRCTTCGVMKWPVVDCKTQSELKAGDGIQG